MPPKSGIMTDSVIESRYFCNENISSFHPKLFHLFNFLKVKAIGKGLALLAFGSSFFHASQTSLGAEADLRMIDLTFWIMYQEAISYVRPGVTNVTNMNSTEFFEVPDSVLIRDLSYRPR